jgi:hypothetical protein
MDKCSLSVFDLTKRAVGAEGKKIRARGARLLTDNLRTIYGQLRKAWKVFRIVSDISNNADAVKPFLGSF